MAIQTFTAGQILTAAQMTSLQANDYNHTVSTKTANYVLVAADKGTRVVMNVTGASTVTVNTSLFSAGDTLYIQNISASACTVTAGTATVSSAGPLAIPQNGSGILYFTSAGVSIYYPSAVTATTPGLVCVKAETAFSAVTSITADNVFTSTYTNYLFILNATASSNSDTSFKLRVGGVSASTNYNSQQLEGSGSTAAATRVTAQTSALISAMGTTTSCIRLELFGPQLAAVTAALASVYYNTASGILRLYGANHTTATAYDGIEILASSTITGTYSIYGYSKTV